MNILSDLSTHRHSFKFTEGCLVSPYFPRWMLRFGKNEYSSTAPRPVPICCLYGRNASVPVPWGPGFSFLCKGTDTPMLGRLRTSHSAGHVKWVWWGGHSITPKLTFSSGGTIPGIMSRRAMLWVWGVRVGWGPSPPELASPGFLPAERQGVSPKLRMPPHPPCTAEIISSPVWRKNALQAVRCSDTVVKMAM